jgi:hypothetical protein
MTSTKRTAWLRSTILTWNFIRKKARHRRLIRSRLRVPRLRQPLHVVPSRRFRRTAP